MSKIDSVLKHLKKKGHITSWEAIQLYRATRLADIIFQLKGRGHTINTVMLTSNGTRYAKYVMVKSK